jgi:hypothetical protein
LTAEEMVMEKHPYYVNFVFTVVKKDRQIHPQCHTQAVTFETHWDVPYVPRVGDTVLVPRDPGCLIQVHYKTVVEKVFLYLERGPGKASVDILLSPFEVEDWNEFGKCCEGPGMCPGFVETTLTVV